MVKTRYSRNPWKQFAQRLQEIPQSSLRVNKNHSLVKCRKHTDLVMKALQETARDTGYISMYMFLGLACK